MRRRAYRPERPGCLENRSLLSGLAGASADPVVISRRQIVAIAQQLAATFAGFDRDPVIPDLRGDLYNIYVAIPFAQADGLGKKVNAIVTNMVNNLDAHVPHAVITAQTEVLDAAHAELKARVQAGDVVVYG